MSESDQEQVKRFPSALRGYATADVDAYLAEIEELLERTSRERDDLQGNRDDLEREVARLQGELDATRAALPEIEDLHRRLEELRAEYATRLRALELLLAASAREVGERLSSGRPDGSREGAEEDPSGEVGEVTEASGAPQIAEDTDEIPVVPAGSLPAGSDEPVRGAWALPDEEPSDPEGYLD